MRVKSARVEDLAFVKEQIQATIVVPANPHHVGTHSPHRCSQTAGESITKEEGRALPYSHPVSPIINAKLQFGRVSGLSLN